MLGESPLKEPTLVGKTLQSSHSRGTASKFPRIHFRSNLFLQELEQHAVLRYGIAAGLALLPVMLTLLFGERLANEFYLSAVFLTVLMAGVFGGLGPGLLATLLAVLSGYAVSRWRLTFDEIRLLLIGGTLTSIGGTLRAAFIKSRENFRHNLRVEQEIVELSDEELHRIGHDLHDGLGQHLTGLSMLSESIAQQLQAGSTPEPADFERITHLTSQAISITRDLAKSLSPITLETEGLSAALVQLAENCSSLFGIRCTCEGAGENFVVEKTRSLHLFRVVQEAVNNAVRHGKARNIRIAIVRENNMLKVTIVDDGVGLSQKTTDQPGLGLRIMEHRATMLHASLTVERASAQGGTIVTCICPVDDEARGRR